MEITKIYAIKAAVSGTINQSIEKKKADNKPVKTDFTQCLSSVIHVNKH